MQTGKIILHYYYNVIISNGMILYFYKTILFLNNIIHYKVRNHNNTFKFFNVNLNVFST